MHDEPNLPINDEVCFSDAKGKLRPRQQKKSLKILARLAPLLRRVMEPGEEIQFVTQGASPYSLLELLTTGRFIHAVKLCVLIVTDRRILQLPAWSLYRPKSSVAELRFADLASAETKGLLQMTLQLQYQNGSKEKFSAVQAGKKLASCLEGRAGRGAPGVGQGRRHLCPRCAAPLGAGSSECAACHLPFKTKKKALLWSLLLPGGGYFYTGQRLLGILDALVEGFLLFGLVFALPTVGDGEPGSVALVLGLFALLALEKAITVYHANHAIKEFLPAEPKQLATAPAAGGGVPGTAPGEFAAPLEP
jgi:hypothetical protein